MSRKSDLLGKKFGKLTVYKESSERTKCRRVQWFCKCDCGKKILAVAQNLVKGNQTSCGCSHVNEHHGMRNSPEYRVWSTMLTRCGNPKAKRYERYGGRGIRVCARWRNSFEAFYKDMGPRPNKDMQLDRIDNDGNYIKSNCRWVSRIINANNKSNSVNVDYRGKTYTVGELARKYNVDYYVLYSRLKQGWSVSKALRTQTI